MNDKVKVVLAQLRHYLKTLYGEQLEQIVLYGSQARGDAKPDSDIDVLIVLKQPVDSATEIERTGEFTSHLCLENNVLISRTFTSLAQFKYETGGFFRNVRREGIAI